MSYADHNYYTDTYLGNVIQKDDFPRLALRASSFLDYYTQGRAAKHPDMEALKMACCALAEQIQVIENAEALAQKALTLALSSSSSDGEIQSETVGSYSVTRRSGGDSAKSAAAAAKTAQEQLAGIVKRYLAGTGLIYRGGCPCTPHTL